MIWRPFVSGKTYGSFHFVPLGSCILRFPRHYPKRPLFSSHLRTLMPLRLPFPVLCAGREICTLMAARQNSYVFSTLSEMGKVTGEGGGEEFEEEEIWAVVARLNLKNTGRDERRRENALRRQPSASRMVPKSRNEKEEASAGWRAQSAPVNIPDWSQMRKKERALRIIRDEEDEQEEEDEVFDKGEMVPPHQLVARQLARSQMASFSMCEGAGRTLKGRDLSRVRNAVLTRTGFLE